MPISFLGGMARPLRFLPCGSMVEVTLRTVHGRLLLRPSPRLNEITIGVIGRAQRTYGVKIHAVAVLSNHVHLALSPESPQQLADFMSYLAGNLAREVGKLHDWRDKIWARRYRAIVISHEEDAQVERLAYILGQGVKEGLVERPQYWPGVHCAAALLAGKDLEGTWFDRTGLYQARHRGQEATAADFAHAERIVFTPLPCWGHLEADVYRCRIAELIRKLVDEVRRHRAGRGVLGKRAILAQHPHDKPLHSDRSPAPLVHAATQAVRVMLRTAYYEFVAAFREAAAQLRRGDRFVHFPAGAFPPALPSTPATS
jgi:REP element-mobilizing transposase RayT